VDTANPAPHGKPVAAYLIALGDVIELPGGHVGEVTSKEQDKGEDADVLLGCLDVRTGESRWMTYASSDLVTVLRPSPARAA
jgi:hypothetical protein